MLAKRLAPRPTCSARGCAGVTAALFVLGITSMGCEHKPAPGESVAEVCRIDNNGKEVVVSGTLQSPFLMFACTTSCSLQLVPDRRERYGIELSFDVGSGPRTMNAVRPKKGRLPAGAVERIPRSALEVRTDEEEMIGPGDSARVRGVLHASQDGDRVHCSMRPTELHSVD